MPAAKNHKRGVRRKYPHLIKWVPAFVKIHYRDIWFWIDDRNLKSKRTFSFMMMLFTSTDTGRKENLSLITIAAQ